MAILAYPDVQLLDVAGPLQVFATANEHAVAAGLQRPYRPQVVAACAGPLTASAGLGLLAEPLPTVTVDTLLVAGGPGVEAAMRDTVLLHWITHQARQARRIASVCTGAFLLAATGLLDGRRVTTHWRRSADLARRFPALVVDDDPIYLQDGVFWTSAGVTAGIDLALALVEADLGRAASLAVARHLVVFARRPGGQAQFSASLELEAAAAFEDLHGWLRSNLHRPLTVPLLAERAGMSERSFVRHYRTATGMTPARAIERLRVEAARQRLGQGASMKQIARSCGFGSEETMRRSFLRVLAVSPGAYRERFPA